MLDHINPEDFLPFYHFKIHLKIFLCPLISSIRSPSLNIRHQYPITMPLLPHTCHISSPSHVFCHITTVLITHTLSWGVCSRTVLMHCSCVFCCVGVDRVVVCCVVWGFVVCRQRVSNCRTPIHEGSPNVQMYLCHRINPE